MCLYFENFINILGKIKKLIKADREADFLLHIEAVGELCPVFTGGDGVNYQRCGSFYYELLKYCKSTQPELYTEFLKGNFVVQTTEGVFKSVAPDMKLEQTIQRSSKSSKGIIGNTRSIGYVTEWCLIYQEVLGIKNTLQDLVNPNCGSGETQVHHELSESKISQRNSAVDKIKQFIKERSNPYLLVEDSIQLINISSRMIPNPDVVVKHLNFPDLSKEKYNDFRKRVYIDRTSLLSDTIHQFKLFPVDHCFQEKRDDTKSVKDSEKHKKIGRVNFDLICQRLGNREITLQYDITPYNPFLMDLTWLPLLTSQI